MTNQQKKQWLQQYRLSGKEIDRLELETEQWTSLAERTTASICSTPISGGGGDRLQQCVDHLDEVRHQQADAIERWLQLRKDILTAIDTVPDERLRLLLHYRYIDGHTFEQIAVETNYSFRQVLRLHGDALSEMRPKMSLNVT